jgi:hypothetical protein
MTIEIKNPEETLLVLKKVRAKIEEGWCQGTVGQTLEGYGVDADNPRAVRWCLRGAISLVGGDENSDALQILREAAGQRGFSGVMDFNDSRHTRQETVLDLLDQTIEKVMKGQL